MNKTDVYEVVKEFSNKYKVGDTIQVHQGVKHKTYLQYVDPKRNGTGKVMELSAVPNRIDLTDTTYFKFLGSIGGQAIG